MSVRLTAALLAAILAAAPTSAGAADESAPLVEIYMPSPCLSCIDWGEHLINAGFRVSFKERTDMAAIKRYFSVPKEVESVQTARVGNYFIEGHVPAADIWQLLAEKPRARGLAVPGLPMGAPGREVHNSSLTCETGCTILDPNATHDPRRESYETLLVTPNGKAKTFARH